MLQEAHARAPQREAQFVAARGGVAIPDERHAFGVGIAKRFRVRVRAAQRRVAICIEATQEAGRLLAQLVYSPPPSLGPLLQSQAPGLGKGLSASLGYYGTSAEISNYSSTFDAKFLGGRGAVLGVKYNF